MMTSNPSGTVTFLFTDIENSTQLAREHPESWEAARARHHAILRKAIELNNGFVFQIVGDAFCAAFHKAGEALKASIKAQQDLQDEPWGEFTIYVRMGIHTGEAEIEGDEYRGYTTLSFVQRLMSAGHGGQILVSNTSENLLWEQLPGQISLRDMGMQKFAGVPFPVHIFQVIAPDLPQKFPPLRTLDNLPNNLPVQLTSFVGREKELADVRKLLHDTRMLTLIGSGGTGKTRLSIEAACEMLDQYPDGVWFVELAPILDPLLVPRTTAIAIGLRDEPQRPVIDMLCNYLHEKKMLIILDNCEHLVDACARMADRILHAAPDICILASSRETLGIGGEVSYRVPSLGLPDISQLPSVESLSQYEAVKLFIDRAKSAVPTFTVTNDNAPALAQVCHHLDGIPLAIELAAAKIRVLSVEQIAKRLDDRFRLLTGGSRTALERHQTLRAAIDWSYNLLSPAEQVLFQRLSVFIGGWRLEAAESVCEDEVVKNEDVLNLLEQLINKSLVIKEEAENESWYHMLETIRQYANEKLIGSGESGMLRDRHLEYFLNLAETAEPYLIRTEQIEWLPLLDFDHENLRFALEWALNKESPEPSLNLSRALSWFWWIRCYWLEGLSWVKRALAKPVQAASRNEKIARARALYTRALLEWRLGHSGEQISSLAEASLALALEVSDRRDIAVARYYAGVGSMFQGEGDDKARSLLAQSFSDFEELDEPFWQAFSFHYLSAILVREARLEQHEATARSLELTRKAGERSMLAGILSGTAEWLSSTNRLDEARAYAEEADKVNKELGSQNVSGTLPVYANIAWLEGDTQRAASLYTELLEYEDLLGDTFGRTYFLTNLGIVVKDGGNLDRAKGYLEKALVLARETGYAFFLARCLAELSNLSYLQGNIEGFKLHFKECFSLRNKLAQLQKANVLLTILESLYFQKPESSAQVLGVVDHLEKEDHVEVSLIYKRYCSRAEAYARESLGNAKFEFTLAEGQKTSLDEAFDLALNAVEEIDEIILPTSTKPEIMPDRLPSRLEADKQKYGGLTSREREVAAQIAQGKSNQAIASELFVGLKTVEAHVTRILSKLGFASRAQIAAWAVAKGLAEAPRDLDTLGREG